MWLLTMILISSVRHKSQMGDQDCYQHDHGITFYYA